MCAIFENLTKGSFKPKNSFEILYKMNPKNQNGKKVRNVKKKNINERKEEKRKKYNCDEKKERNRIVTNE